MVGFVVKKITDNLKIVKFLIAGGTATLTTFFFLYLFTEVFLLWYLFSSILAFLIAVVVSFTLQKYWTFAGEQEKRGRHQFVIFLAFGAFGLGLNVLSMYLLVDRVGLWYMLAQFITSAGIAVMNYFFYQSVVFKPRLTDKS
jgi:putative flippase GtrA